MKKIIVPTDFSEASKSAIEYAQQLASKLEASVSLVYVYHPAPVMVNEVSYINPEIEVIQREQFEKFVKKYQTQLQEQNSSVQLDGDFKIGFPADVILQLSKTEEHCTIIMGSTGSTGSLKRYFGSVSTKVARTSKCPVIIVPPGTTFEAPVNIAYCTDSIFLDSAAVHKIVNIAKPFDASIHLIHVERGNDYEEKDVLRLWTSFYPEEKVKLVTLEGESRMDCINDYCKSNRINLIAMSTEERGFFDELFHRSFTKRMAIHTHIPLLVAHNKEVNFFE